MGKSMGDSGTFGSQKTMNAIYKAQHSAKPSAMITRPTMSMPIKGSFKKGGKVPSTGAYKLHKGEKVISKSQLDKAASKHMFNSRSSK